MSLGRLSIRSNVLALIILMGVWAFVLAMAMVYFSTKFILENEKEAYGRLVQIHADELLEKLGSDSVNLALKMQRQDNFRKAFKERDQPELTNLLNDQFNQYYYTTGIIDIKKLVALDKNLNFVAKTKARVEQPINYLILCEAFLAKAKMRKGGDKIKPMTALCLDNNRPLYLSLSAVGGLKVEGYILVISDPLPVLQQLKDKLGNPLTIFDTAGSLRFQSHQESQLEALTAFEYDYLNQEEQLAYRLLIHRDITSLGAQMQRFMIYAGGVALLITFCIVLIAITVLKHFLVEPLERITAYFGKVVQSNSNLGEPINIRGNKEVIDLVDNLNLMTGHMNDLNTKLEKMAYHDSLTAIPNRLAFNDRIEELTRFARKDDQGFCVFIIDLNRFKEINDNMGHDVGDELLKHVATKVSEKVRESDLLARLGGDEFGIIFPGLTSIQDAEALAKHMLLHAQEEVDIKGNRIKPGISIGFAFYTDNSKDVSETLRQADQSMYQAKKTGCGYSYKVE